MITQVVNSCETNKNLIFCKKQLLQALNRNDKKIKKLYSFVIICLSHIQLSWNARRSQVEEVRARMYIRHFPNSYKPSLELYITTVINHRRALASIALASHCRPEQHSWFLLASPLIRVPLLRSDNQILRIRQRNLRTSFFLSNLSNAC